MSAKKKHISCVFFSAGETKLSAALSQLFRCNPFGGLCCLRCVSVSLNPCKPPPHPPSLTTPLYVEDGKNVLLRGFRSSVPLPQTYHKVDVGAPLRHIHFNHVAHLFPESALLYKISRSEHISPRCMDARMSDSTETRTKKKITHHTLSADLVFVVSKQPGQVVCVCLWKTPCDWILHFLESKMCVSCSTVKT